MMSSRKGFAFHTSISHLWESDGKQIGAKLVPDHREITQFVRKLAPTSIKKNSPVWYRSIWIRLRWNELFSSHYWNQLLKIWARRKHSVTIPNSASKIKQAYLLRATLNRLQAWRWKHLVGHACHLPVALFDALLRKEISGASRLVSNQGRLHFAWIFNAMDDLRARLYLKAWARSPEPQHTSATLKSPYTAVDTMVFTRGLTKLETNHQILHSSSLRFRAESFFPQ